MLSKSPIVGWLNHHFSQFNTEPEGDSYVLILALFFLNLGELSQFSTTGIISIPISPKHFKCPNSTVDPPLPPDVLFSGASLVWGASVDNMGTFGLGETGRTWAPHFGGSISVRSMQGVSFREDPFWVPERPLIMWAQSSWMPHKWACLKMWGGPKKYGSLCGQNAGKV